MQSMKIAARTAEAHQQGRAYYLIGFGNVAEWETLFPSAGEVAGLG